MPLQPPGPGGPPPGAAPSPQGQEHPMEVLPKANEMLQNIVGGMEGAVPPEVHQVFAQSAQLFAQGMEMLQRGPQQAPAAPNAVPENAVG